MVEDWKLTYYQRTLSRNDKLDAINRNFSKLKGKPHDFENSIEDLEPAPLSILAAERIAEEAEKKGNITAKKCTLSEASIYCGEDSFGHAPKVEISVDDTKQRLLNAERFVLHFAYKNKLNSFKSRDLVIFRTDMKTMELFVSFSSCFSVVSDYR